MAGLTVTSTLRGHERMQPLKSVLDGLSRPKHLLKRMHERITLEVGACRGLLTGQSEAKRVCAGTPKKDVRGFFFSSL